MVTIAFDASLVMINRHSKSGLGAILAKTPGPAAPDGRSAH